MKNLFKGLGILVLAFVFSFSVAGKASAIVCFDSLTFGTDSITSECDLAIVSGGALNVSGAVGSTNTLYATTTTGSLTLGTGLTTGDLTIGNNLGTGSVYIYGGTSNPNYLFTNVTTGAVNIGTAVTSGNINIGGSQNGAGQIFLGGGTSTGNINIGGNGVGQFINIGSTGGSKTINIGWTDDSNTIRIGRAVSSTTLGGTLTYTVSTAVAATNMAVVSSFVNVTGATTITTITGGVAGQILILKFPTTGPVITDTAIAGAPAGSVSLSAGFTGAAGSTLTLINDGNGWQEIARSING